MRGFIKKWGNSAAVRLPSVMMKALKLEFDSAVELKVENDTIVIEPLRSQEYILARLLTTINANNLHAKIDLGTSQD